jgi:hypothetical protein
MSLAKAVATFKQCPICQTFWESVRDFLEDEHIRLIGYQTNFRKLESGLLLFNHDCETTLSLKVQAFAYLYDGPVFTKHLAGTEACPGYCLHRNELRPCPEQCECAYVREILEIIQNWPKVGAKQTALLKKEST